MSDSALKNKPRISQPTLPSNILKKKEAFSKHAPKSVESVTNTFSLTLANSSLFTKCVDSSRMMWTNLTMGKFSCSIALTSLFISCVYRWSPRFWDLSRTRSRNLSRRSRVVCLSDQYELRLMDQARRFEPENLIPVKKGRLASSSSSSGAARYMLALPPHNAKPRLYLKFYRYRQLSRHFSSI